LYLARAEGARLYDVDGNSYIDFMLGAGPAILGHRHPAILEAVQTALMSGLPNIAVTETQLELAALVTKLVPSMERVRFVPTGTEAVQAVIKLARRATGRKLIAKFEGAYHGQAENVCVSVAVPASERGPIASPNRVPYHCALPDELAALTLVLPFNDPEATRALIEEHAKDLALVLVEPMLGFAGAIPAEPEFLRGLREVTARHGVLLAFDEVITGFRVALGGGQAHYGVTPDLTVLGKAVGGGMPLSAFGGRADLMDWLSAEHHPEDYVFQSGTFSAFPMSLAAGLATLRILESTDALPTMLALGERARAGLKRIVGELGIAADVTGLGSLFHLHFTSAKVRSGREAQDADHARSAALHAALLAHGQYFYVGRLGFLSAAHTAADIDAMLAATRTVLAGG
jgi:glutamate-1-semialdehyde 2,1-aminomutase